MDSTAISTERQVTLAELAGQINEEHRKAEGAMNDGLQHALAAGRLLREAKQQCGHGDWLTWLYKNFKGSKRTAQAYLRLHREYPQLQRKAQRVALLSMRQAMINVANDTHIIYKHDGPIRGDIIDYWQKSECRDARRAVARLEANPTRWVTTPKKPDPAVIDRDSPTAIAAQDALDAAQAVLMEVPEDKQERVLAWAQEKANGAEPTAACIREAYQEVLQAEPDDDRAAGGDEDVDNRAAAGNQMPVPDYEKTERFALECARCAITQLEQIKKSNVHLDKAFDNVEQWIHTQREEAEPQDESGVTAAEAGAPFDRDYQMEFLLVWNRERMTLWPPRYREFLSKLYKQLSQEAAS